MDEQQGAGMSSYDSTVVLPARRVFALHAEGGAPCSRCISGCMRPQACRVEAASYSCCTCRGEADGPSCSTSMKKSLLLAASASTSGKRE